MQEIPQPRTLKERQRQEREALILRTAEEVLLEKGYHEMSMDEIALRVGIAKGTLYLHFAKKEELVAELIERELLTFLQKVEQMILTDGDVKSQLSSLLHAMYQGFAGKRFLIFYVLHNSSDMAQILVEKKKTLQALMERFSSRVGALLDEGKRTGVFDQSLPTPVMLNIFFSTLSPLAFKRLVIDGGMSPDEVVRYVERLYFKGIAADSPPGEV